MVGGWWSLLAACRADREPPVGPADSGRHTAADPSTGDDHPTGDDHSAAPEPDAERNEVALTHLSFQGAEIPSSAQFTAQFRRIVAPAHGAIDFPVPGDESCTNVVYSTDDVGTPEDLESVSAGAVSMLSPVALGPLLPDPELEDTYHAVIPVRDFPFDEPATVEVTGDAFPGFTSELRTPARLDLAAPGADFVLAGVLDVSWSGGDRALPITLLLETHTLPDPLQPQTIGLARCRAANDGAFTIPREILDQLPPGIPVLSIEQADATTLEVGGHAVQLVGTVRSLVVGTIR